MGRYYKKDRLRFGVQAVGLSLITWVIVSGKAFLTPDILFLFMLGIFILFGQAKTFILKFAPFAVLLVAYDSFRSIAPFLNSHVNYIQMIDFDRALFGGTTPIELFQSWLFHGHIQWYDFYFYGLYMMHFIMPFMLAVLIWKTRPDYYWRFVSAFVVLSFAAFITYVVFPAAPPWMAADKGLIPQIHKISTDVWYAMGVHDFPSVYRALSPNLVAAVPSLHAAYPTMALLFVLRLYGWRWALPFSVYPLSMWFGVVYMGEHYAFDVIAGIVYVFVTFFAVLMVFRWFARRRLGRSGDKTALVSDASASAV